MTQGEPARGDRMGYWQKICCAVDFSDVSRLAMDQAAYLARVLGSELTLIHVHEERSGWSAPTPSRALGDAYDTLASWRSQAEFLADRPVGQAMLEGTPQDEIVRFARDGDYDAIVLGTSGRTGLKQLMLGSVAEYVVRRAHCPVIAVRKLTPKPSTSASGTS